MILVSFGAGNISGSITMALAAKPRLAFAGCNHHQPNDLWIIDDTAQPPDLLITGINLSFIHAYPIMHVLEVVIPDILHTCSSYFVFCLRFTTCYKLHGLNKPGT